jgi:membrane-bound lytic murein transglycosylase F
LGHITDAQKLASKYRRDPSVWGGHVEEFLVKKSQPEFFQDPAVKLGYCKCVETVNYVREVLDRYDQYSVHIAATFPLAGGG